MSATAIGILCPGYEIVSLGEKTHTRKIGLRLLGPNRFRVIPAFSYELMRYFHNLCDLAGNLPIRSSRFDLVRLSEAARIFSSTMRANEGR